MFFAYVKQIKILGIHIQTPEPSLCVWVYVVSMCVFDILRERNRDGGGEGEIEYMYVLA